MIRQRAEARQDTVQEWVRIERQLKRLKQLFVLGGVVEVECQVERIRLRMRLAALTPPATPDLEWVAELLQDFGEVWDAAPLKERQQIVHTSPEDFVPGRGAWAGGIHRAQDGVHPTV